RLERGPDDDRLAARHPALGPACVVRPPDERFLSLVEIDLVVDGGAGTAGGLEPEADLDALRGLDAHERVREPAVELPVPLRVAPEPRRCPDDDRLDDAAERVARLLALVDARDDAALGVGVRHPDRRFLRPHEDVLGREPGVIRRDAADLRDPPHDADAERREERLREAADRDPRGGLARARALEDVPDVAMVVLERAGEIGVPGPRARDREIRIAILRARRHLLLPVPPVAVLDPERDRRAERLAPTDAGANLGFVLLDLHATAAAVAAHAALQIAIDRVDGDRDAGGEALDDSGQPGSVRLPGGEVTERHVTRPDDAPPTDVRREAVPPCRWRRPSAS